MNSPRMNSTAWAVLVTSYRAGTIRGVHVSRKLFVAERHDYGSIAALVAYLNASSKSRWVDTRFIYQAVPVCDYIWHQILWNELLDLRQPVPETPSLSETDILNYLGVH
jgi:hypothetical protein